MPKIVSPGELNEIAELIARHPDGIGLEALLRSVGNEISRRTLQRRLASLAALARIVTAGEGRALKYRLAPVAGEGDIVPALIPGQASGEIYVPLSPEGEDIKAYVRQPLHQRRPVSYDIRFLEAYRPNETFYLPAALRAQLHSLGRSPAEQSAAGTFARDIMNRLLIDLSWASSRLEGNTYTRLDTERLIEYGLAAEGKDGLETQMILNHKAAIEYLVREVDGVGVNTETILALHALLSDGLLRDPQAGGRVRKRAVEISGSVYLPIALPQRLDALLGIVLDMAGEIRDPFEQAFFLMAHLPYLQAFEDVNKRVSRLAANIPLIRCNLCPLSFIDVPEQAYIDAMIGVYELARIELLRDVFVWAYERSCQQYVAVRQQLIPPDLFRLRYRAELTEAVRSIVRGGRAASTAAMRAVIPATVAEGDRAKFVALLAEEFKNLHEGNAIRFRLRPLEFVAWNQESGKADKLEK
ncbi:MAG: Fic/DOC family protein [Candidatus Accumulibacter appositus]|uniref:Fic/DOC family protein n=1 Tax=Candidatus Accumulibacter appositus TaxID=1454003 RepID=A0A011NQC8_9PROT|nr:Fic family protein [Accumulibacter sp.]EXI77486.1 MAG: Fic/DOC family protein [Candidatus Accumulibacter appositus]HRF06717.1 Fic family protein [Accumulibacter sp.]